MLPAFVDQPPNRGLATERDPFAQPLRRRKPLFSGLRSGGSHGRQYSHGPAVARDRDRLPLFDLIEELRLVVARVLPVAPCRAIASAA